MGEPHPPAPRGETTPGMSGAIVASTTLFALAHGLEPETLERVTGLKVAELNQPDARFSNDVVARIWCALDARHPERPLTLRMAEAAPLTFFGPLAHGVRFAADLRAALETFVRYRGLLSSDLQTRLVEEGDRAAFESRHSSDALDAGAGAEVGVAIGRRFVDEVLGMADAVVGIELSHAPRGPLEDYEAFFGVPVRFGAPRTAICFDRAALGQAPPRRDAELFEYIEAHLRTAHERLRRRDALEQVRAAIAANAARQTYSADALARRLGVSLRALQRQVSSHGATVRQLIDEARRAQAEQLLSDPRLSVDEVAFVLDYSDERAFRRAFERWTGHSPAQFRASL